LCLGQPQDDWSLKPVELAGLLMAAAQKKAAQPAQG